MIIKGKRAFILIFFILAFFAALIINVYFRSRPPKDMNNYSNLPPISIAELKEHDGTNQDIPIYIGLDGYVYDVTPGKNFYGLAGTYHRLAGKDASLELRIFGGDIIKSKYRVVGTLVP